MAAAYLLGSLSGARIIARLSGANFDVEDMTVVVDGTGATAVATGVSPSTLYARAGAKGGLSAAVIDIAKAFVPTLAAAMLAEEPFVPVLVASASLIGHVFPIYHRFNGGFGISPLIGGLLVLDPWSVPVTISVFALFGLILGSAYVGIETWSVGLLGWFAVFGDEWELGYAALANVIYWSRSWREAQAAFRSWRKDPRPWRERVADFKTYPDYEAP